MYRLHGFFTQNTMKTLYVLEQLGVEYEFVYVDLMKGENRTDSFRKMTPIGKVPVLEHDGKFLFESGAICRYVANREQSELYPAEPYERAKVDQWMDFFSCHLGRFLTTIYFERIIKPKANLGEPNDAACEEAANLAHQNLKAMERSLADAKYLAGETPSIAPLFALAYIEQVRVIDFPLDDYPRVSAWYEHLDGLERASRARARLHR